MSKANIIAVFDVGKTNKKLLLFDERYKIVSEESVRFDEIKDEDGFACENLQLLTNWIQENFFKISSDEEYNLIAVNFSAYGASLVHLDHKDKPLTPLYNYLKPFPEKLKKQFYNNFDNEKEIAIQTCSPVLGNLNSGMQLYRLKYAQPEVFSRLKYSLHLPQYLSFLISKINTSDITSIGCHTMLWDFEKNEYHKWVYAEHLDKKLAPIFPSDKTIAVANNSRKIAVGIGLHDSSASLIPYLKLYSEPFILISTGTWCISFNPFNESLLTDDELQNDCTCYLTFEKKVVKASRLFAGYQHEEQAKRLADYYHKDFNFYQTIIYDHSLLKNLSRNPLNKNGHKTENWQFENRVLNDFKTYEEAYHQLMFDIMQQQIYSTKLVLNNAVKQIFVDGGFGKNDVYMNLLAAAFPDLKVYGANIPQASSLGAALILHSGFQTEPSSDFIRLKYYPFKKEVPFS